MTATATLASVHRTVEGDLTVEYFTMVVTGTSYTSAGVAIDLVKEFGLTQAVEIAMSPASTGYVPVWNGDTDSPVVHVLYGDNNNASDGVLIEIPDSTDISATTFHGRIAGK